MFLLLFVVTPPMPCGSLGLGPSLKQNPHTQDPQDLNVETGLDPLLLPAHLHVPGTCHLLILSPRTPIL